MHKYAPKFNIGLMQRCSYVNPRRIPTWLGTLAVVLLLLAPIITLNLSSYPHRLPNPPQHLQRPLQLFLCVGRGHDGADAGFAFWDCGEGNAGAKDAFFEKLAGKVHGEFAVTDDDGRDR